MSGVRIFSRTWKKDFESLFSRDLGSFYYIKKGGTGMIQDIAPMKFHNEYQQRECRDKDIVFLFSGNKLLVKKDSKISFFYMKAVSYTHLTLPTKA